MLVLSRKVGEEIKIDGGITVAVLRIKGKEVRIGVVAPAETKILRAELPAHDAPESSASPE